MFKGGKTRVFWWGMIIFGLSLFGLFNSLWSMFINGYSGTWRYLVPYIFGSLVFLFIGLYMMKSGTKSEQDKAHENSP